MDIKNIENLDIGMSNIVIEGDVNYASDAKNWKGESKGRKYNFWSQFVAVEDDTDSIGCSVTIKKEEDALEEGDHIKIRGKLEEYEDKEGNMQRKLRGRIVRDKGDKKEAAGEEKVNNVKEEKKENAEKRANNTQENKNLYIARECAIKASVELIVAKIIKPKGLFPYSEKIVNYIFEGYQIVGAEAEEKASPDKEEKIALARHIAREKKLEIREGHEDDKIDEEEKIIDDEEDIPGSSPENAIPFKGKKKKLNKISKAEDFIVEEDIPE